MLAAGPLDRRVTLLRPAPAAKTAFNEKPAASFADAFTAWASKSPVSDAERTRAAQAAATITDRFRLRWSSAAAEIDTTWRLRYPPSPTGTVYGIVAVKEIGRREGLEISAVARAEKAQAGTP